jgi:protein-S-isoprenylcysteine O-methyltransferase Ste14
MTRDEGLLARVHVLFNDEALRKVLTRLRLPLGIAGAVLVLWFFPPRAEWFWPAFGVSLAGALLQTWCFASLHKKRELACSGPYAFVRNPMYLGRFLLVGGALLLTGQPWILLPYALVYYFYMVNRVKREEAVLAPLFGEVYARYCAEVPRFWPRLAPYGQNRVAYFRWKLFFKNNAHWNLLAVLALYAAAGWFLFGGA